MLEHWNLKNNPFQENTGFDSLYFSDDLSQLVKNIEREIKDKNRMVLVLGEKGAGKTSFKLWLADFLKKSGFTVVMVGLSAEPGTGVRFFEEIFNRIIESESPQGSLNYLLNRVETHVINSKSRYVLLIDEAHFLKQQADFRTITDWFQKISTDKQAFLKVVMFGEPELSNIMYKSFVLARPFIQLFINPFDFKEAREYIKNKVESAGVIMENIFTEEALENIFELSGGFPSKMNSLCWQSMMFGAEQQSRIIDKNTVVEAAEKMIKPAQNKQSHKEAFFKSILKEDIKNLLKGEPVKSAPEHTLYDEVISFAREIFNRKDRSFSLADMKDIKENVSKIIDHMLSGDSRLLIMSKQETSDNYLLAHSVNVCILAVKLGIGMGYDRNRLNKLGMSAFLHDIGMLDIYNITDNSNELNVKEIIEIKKHPGKGSDLLAQMEIKTIINENIHIAAIHQHHERIDGSGYPRGLKNGEIDEFARIIGIVDVYEALTHKRKHRDSMISTEAIGAIVRTGDNKFGPDIVKALIEELSFYPIGSFVRMVTGEIGRVIKINKNMPTRPVIKLMFDRDSNKLTGREIDLSQDTKYAIKSAIDERKFNFLKEIDNVQVQKY